ncbi:unnamed protein product [Protopolystoma xenopodis]|uniref:Uncharacterized protein n=1 Tax=Protopolystoma xenopodis TaxID=117903 RepID=A0A3S5FFN3_9PLAT|nr:unnamed protein product [Protopolystoma xenopodis]
MDDARNDLTSLLRFSAGEPGQSCHAVYHPGSHFGGPVHCLSCCHNHSPVDDIWRRACQTGCLACQHAVCCGTLDGTRLGPKANGWKPSCACDGLCGSKGGYGAMADCEYGCSDEIGAGARCRCASERERRGGLAARLTSVWHYGNGLLASLPPPAKSSCTVRALTYTDLHSLDREDLAELIILYPELAECMNTGLEFTFPLVDAGHDFCE